MNTAYGGLPYKSDGGDFRNFQGLKFVVGNRLWRLSIKLSRYLLGENITRWTSFVLELVPQRGENEFKPPQNKILVIYSDCFQNVRWSPQSLLYGSLHRGWIMCE